MLAVVCQYYTMTDQTLIFYEYMPFIPGTFTRVKKERIIIICCGRFQISRASQDNETNFDDWLMKMLQAISRINSSASRWNKRLPRHCIRHLVFAIKLVSFSCTYTVHRVANKWAKLVCRCVSEWKKADFLVRRTRQRYICNRIKLLTWNVNFIYIGKHFIINMKR